MTDDSGITVRRIWQEKISGSESDARYLIVILERKLYLLTSVSRGDILFVSDNSVLDLRFFRRFSPRVSYTRHKRRAIDLYHAEK